MYRGRRCIGRNVEAWSQSGRRFSCLKRHPDFLQLRAGSRATSDEIEAVGVHHLVPRRHEVLHELLLRVRTAIDLGERAPLRVRAEDQVDAVAVRLTCLVLRSRPSYAPSQPADCHSVLMSSRLTKKSLVSLPGE